MDDGPEEDPEGNRIGKVGQAEVGSIPSREVRQMISCYMYIEL